MCCEILSLEEWLKIRVKEADSEFSRCVTEHRLKEYEELEKENRSLKAKAEAFDCLKDYGLVLSEDLGNEFIGIKDEFLVGFKLDWVDIETMQEKHNLWCLSCGDTEKDKKYYETIKKALGGKQ